MAASSRRGIRFTLATTGCQPWMEWKSRWFITVLFLMNFIYATRISYYIILYHTIITLNQSIYYYILYSLYPQVIFGLESQNLGFQFHQFPSSSTYTVFLVYKNLEGQTNFGRTHKNPPWNFSSNFLMFFWNLEWFRRVASHHVQFVLLQEFSAGKEKNDEKNMPSPWL